MLLVGHFKVSLERTGNKCSQNRNSTVLLVSTSSCVCFLPCVNQIIWHVMCSALFLSHSCLIFSMNTQCGVCEMGLSDVWQARCSTLIKDSVSALSFSHKAFFIQRNWKSPGLCKPVSIWLHLFLRHSLGIADCSPYINDCFGSACYAFYCMAPDINL